MSGILGGFPVTANPNLMAQAAKARQQPRGILSGPSEPYEMAQYAGMIPGLGLLGVGGDIAQYVEKPETRGILPYVLTGLGALPFLGAMAKMAGPMPKGILKSQAGAIAYHGSPHKFDAFDASKIGTGEGAQAYGHGIYFAESPNVAKTYSGPARMDYMTKDGSMFYPEDGYQQAALNLVSAHGSAEKALAKVQSMATQKGNEPLINALKEMSDKGVSIQKSGGGNFYKADIPDEWLPKMLDWDKPLSQQSEAVKDLAKQWNGGKMPVDSMSGDEFLRYIQSQLRGIGRGHEKAEDILRQAGIPGIRYLDQGSRVTSQKWVAKHPLGGENTFNSLAELEEFVRRNPEYKAIPAKQTYNYVVFPGMEKQVKILSRD